MSQGSIKGTAATTPRLKRMFFLKTPLKLGKIVRVHNHHVNNEALTDRARFLRISPSH